MKYVYQTCGSFFSSKLKAHKEINKQIKRALKTSKEYYPIKETSEGCKTIISYTNGFEIVKHVLK